MTAFARTWFVVALALFIEHPALADDGDMAVGISDAQLAEIGQRWADAINDNDPATMSRAVDFQALAERTVKTATDNESQRDAFVRGFLTTAPRLPAAWIGQIQSAEGSARYLRVHTFKGVRGPLVRYDLGDAGTNYLLLIVESRAGGSPRVVDMFAATTGQRMSDTLGAIALLLVAPNAALIDRLFGVKRIDADLATTFKEFGDLQRAGRFADAYAKLDELPDSIRDQRVILSLSTALATRLDEATYRRELKRLASRYKDDPTAAFQLIDYYFFENDFKSAMDMVLGMERAFGNDAAIATLKASVAMRSGDLAGAQRFAQQGVDLEPDNESSHWTVVTVAMEAKQYAAGIRALETLERDFGYEFKAANFTSSDVYAGFVKSREFADWTKAR